MVVVGDEFLGKIVRDEAVPHNKARENCETAASKKKEKNIRKLKASM